MDRGYPGVGAQKKSLPRKKESSDTNKVSIKVKASGPVAKQLAPMAKAVAGKMAGK